jgi:hypothetical protein
MLPAALVLALTLAGCSGDSTTATPPATPTMPADTTPVTPPPTLAVADLQAQAENIALVPSPAEMQKALEKAGVAGGLSKLVVERKLKMDVENKDVVAVRTGVVLADALLTVKDSPKDLLVSRLDEVKAGIAGLGAGSDIGKTIDELVANTKNDVSSRDELLKELDDLHGAIIPEIKFEAGERAVPLIQAGSWLEGSNLVASAIIAENKPQAADSLLRQPQVAAYFLKYVEVEGAGKAPDEVLTQLKASLTKLQEIASKPTLTIDDVKEVKAQTDSVLALL